MKEKDDINLKEPEYLSTTRETVVNKYTSVKVTQSTKVLESEILRHMDISKLAFHNRAIDYFYEHGEMHPHLLIKERKHPNYVKKSAVEQVYLDMAHKKKLLEIAEKNNCGYTLVFFNALITYCSVMAPIILGENKVDELVRKD